MTIILDIPFRLTKRDVLIGLGIGVHSSTRLDINELIEDMLRDKNILELIQPAIVYDIHSIIKIEEDGCYLDSGIVLKSDPILHFFPQAKSLAVVIATIGPMLERKVTEYFKQGHHLKGLIMDAMGNSTIENLRDTIHDIINKEAEKAGYTASSKISPGTLDWPLSEQFKLFKLVSADAIGVRLTATALMEPRKSKSMVMGIGDNMPVWNAVQQCDMCPRGQNCPYRYQPEQHDGDSDI